MNSTGSNAHADGINQETIPAYNHPASGVFGSMQFCSKQPGAAVASYGLAQRLRQPIK
jgi:hypothetical protein